jgi:hypothetical protein
MDRWREQLENHQVHSVLSELRKYISKEIEDIDENEFVERRRFEKILSAYERVLTKIDPEIVPINQLDGLVSHLTKQAVPQATEYYNNRNITNLITANDFLSQQLTQLALLQSLSGEIDLAPAPKDLEKQLDGLVNTVAKKQRVSEQMVQSLSESVQAQEQNLANLENQIDVRRQETDARLAEWQQQFSQAQDSRNENYAEWSRDLDKNAQAKVAEIVSRIDTELADKQQSYEIEIDRYLSEADKHSVAIRELHGLAAEDSVAGGYVSNAKREGQAAARWRWISIGFIVAAAIWLLNSFYSREGRVSWEIALFSLPLTGVLLFGAAYSAQQSTRHRNVEVQNRRFALEMAAIDPYLQSLSPSDQQELKKELTKRFFGSQQELDGPSIYDEHITKKVLEAVGSNVIKPFADISKHFK